MRIVKEVPHHRFKITIFSWNNKYIIKIEDAHLEQSFKIDATDVAGLDEVEALLTEEFLLSALKRFVDMGKDFADSYRNRYAHLNKPKT
ncbi:MAG TPA: hypothetical protein VJ894_08045 [Cryomorphaceae bacterium]|nr:hypothetical protein [Cryomorphaceae bacterium]